jgi:hypothetical protein
LSDSRYRVDDGKSCIDIRLRSTRQLYDLRDPAPFRERDLDPGAAEHLMTCVREIPLRTPIKIALFLADGGDVDGDGKVDVDGNVAKAAIRAHFEHERVLVQDSIRENFRNGRRLIVIGLFVLAAFLTISKLLGNVFDANGVALEILREGLVIMGWVALWRPAEVLLYDWVPLLEKRRWIDKLLASEIAVKAVQPSMVPASSPR